MTALAPSSGLPGLRGVEHVGLTVPNLEDAARFFVEVMGCTFVLDGGTIADEGVMRDVLGAEPRATARWCFLRCGRGPNLELFEYAVADQRREGPRNSDVGGHHLAFYVDDMDAALAHLAAHGIEPQGGLQRIEAGPAKGSLWAYVRAPWGLQLELVSYPDGKGDDDSPARRLWHPGREGD